MNFYTKPVITTILCTCGGNLEYGWGDNNYPGSGMLVCSVCGKSSSFCSSPQEALADFRWRHRNITASFTKEARHG